MCVLSDPGEKIERKFGVLTPVLAFLRELQLFHGVGEFAMESTSVYCIFIWRILESDFSLKLVNPYFIKQLPGKKIDVKDAQPSSVEPSNLCSEQRGRS